MPHLALHAKITPKPEFHSNALAALLSFLDATRAELGCLRFEVNAGDGDDNSIYLVELWTDDAALAHHYAQDYTRTIFEAYGDWLAAPVETVHMRRVA